MSVSLSKQPVKIIDLLVHAWIRVQARTEMLILLALLSGLMNAVLFAPAFETMGEIFAAFSSNGDASRETAVALISDGWPTLVWGQLTVTLVSAMLLVPWARAMAPGGITPGGGGSPKMFVRSFRAFWHITLSNVLLATMLGVGLTVLGALASAVGFLSMVVIFAGVFAMVWAAIALNAAAHFAVLLESVDHPTSLFSAWKSLGKNARPATASLGSLFLVYFMVSAMLSSLINGIGLENDRVWLVISGALTFSVSAIHIAALTHFIVAKPVDITV